MAGRTLAALSGVPLAAAALGSQLKSLSKSCNGATWHALRATAARAIEINLTACMLNPYK
jgi:hypothetical protein